MLRPVLDADTLSELVNRRDAAVLARFSEAVADGGPVAVAAPALYEVAFGLERRGTAAKLRRLRNLRTLFEVLPFDELAAVTAGELAAALERAGTPIGEIDPQVAAVALTTNRPLVTGNTRHFEYVRRLRPHLTLIDWRA